MQIVSNDSGSSSPTAWFTGVAVSVLSWMAIGMMTGVLFLAYAIPNRLSHIDNTQDQISKENVGIRIDITKLQDAVQSLRDRVTRLESRP